MAKFRPKSQIIDVYQFATRGRPPEWYVTVLTAGRAWRSPSGSLMFYPKPADTVLVEARPGDYLEWKPDEKRLVLWPYDTINRDYEPIE